MQRITQKDLDNVVKRLNALTDSPETPYKYIDGKYIVQVGCFIIDNEYGGWKLARICNERGGQTTITEGGPISKRDLYNQIHSLINFKYSISGK